MCTIKQWSGSCPSRLQIRRASFSCLLNISSGRCLGFGIRISAIGRRRLNTIAEKVRVLSSSAADFILPVPHRCDDETPLMEYSTTSSLLLAYRNSPGGARRLSSLPPPSRNAGWCSNVGTADVPGCSIPSRQEKMNYLTAYRRLLISGLCRRQYWTPHVPDSASPRSD